MTQTNQEAFGVGLPKVEKVQTDPQFGRPSPIVAEIKDQFPEYRFLSDYHLTGRLTKDNEFGAKVATQILETTLTDETRAALAKKPGSYDIARNDILNNLRTQMMATGYSGEDVRDTVIKRGSQISPSGVMKPTSDIPVGQVYDASTPKVTHDWEPGAVSAHEESGGNPAAISKRKEYGKWQLSVSAGTMQKFISSSYATDFRDRFKDLTPGSAEYDKAFQSIASDPKFIEAQKRFVLDTHYTPAEKGWIKAGIDTSNVAIREAIYSSSVQHSPRGNDKIREEALKNISDPTNTEQVLRAFYTARKNYVAGLTMEGVTEKEKQNILGRYDREVENVVKLMGKRDEPVQDPNAIRDAVNRSPDKYPMFQGPDKKANVPPGKVGDDLLVNEAKANPQFREQVNQDTIKRFEDELAKTHNMPIDPQVDTDFYASAFAIYHGYGSEGLTRFINLMQLGPENQGRVPEAYDPAYKKARAWFTLPGPNGYAPRDFMGSFVGGMVNVEKGKTAEFEYDLPHDYNALTQYGYQFNLTTKTVDKLAPSKFAENLVQAYYTDPNISTKSKSGRNYTMKDNTDFRKELLSEIQRGFGDNYMNLVQDIAFDLQRGEGSFTVQEFMETVGANAKYDPNTGRYVIVNPDQQPPEVRLAIDVLRQNPQTDFMILRDDNDAKETQNLIFAPDRATEAAYGFGGKSLGRTAAKWLRPVTKEETIRDASGNVIGSREVPNNDGIFYWLNTAIAIPVAVANIGISLVEMTTKAGAAVSGALGFEDTKRKFEKYDDDLDDYDLYLQSDPFGDNNAAWIAGTATEFVGLVRAASTMGSGIVNLAKGVSYFNRINKGFKVGSEIAPGLAGSSGGRWAVARNMLNTNNAKLWSGFIALDAGMGENFSVLNTPLLGEDTQRYYRRQDAATKMALNVMAGLAVGEIFDWTLAGTRALYSKGMRGRGYYRPDNPDTWFREIASRTQVGEMVATVSRGLRDIEIGDYAASRAKMFDNTALSVSDRNPENLSDISVGFVSGMGGLVRGLKKDLRDKIVFENEKRSFVLGGKLNEAEIDRKVEDFYNGTIDKIADNTLEFLKAGNRGIDDATWLRFTELLEEGSGMASVRPAADVNGNPLIFGNKAEAIAQTYNRSDDGTLVPNGRFYRELPNDQPGAGYVVYEIENDLWAADLATRIRQKAAEKVDNSAAMKAIAEDKYGVNFTPEQLAKTTQDANPFLGRVGQSLDGENVRILMRDGDDYYVQLPDGTYSKRKLTKHIDPEAEPVARVVGEGLEEGAEREIVDEIPLREARESLRVGKDFLKIRKVGEFAESAMEALRSIGRKVNKKGKGFSDAQLGAISKYTGISVDELRKNQNVLARNLGLEDLDNITMSDGKKRIIASGMGADTTIKDYTPSSRKKTIKKNVAVRTIEDDGSEAFYVTNKQTKLTPSTWVTNESGKLIPNPDWNRLDINPTLHRWKGSGEFQTWVREENGWYRPAIGEERGVLLNIRKPFTVYNVDSVGIKLSDEDLLSNNIDGYYAKVQGVPYYRPVDPGQVLDTDFILRRDVYKATKSDYVEPKLRDAQGNEIVNAPTARVIDDMTDEQVARIVDKEAAGEPLTDFERKVMDELGDEGAEREIFGEPAIKPKDEAVIRSEDEPDVKMAGMGGRFGLSIAGGLLGQKLSEEGDSTPAIIGIAAGFLLGGNKRPSRVAGKVVKYVTKTDNVPGAPAEFTDGLRPRDMEKARALGMASDPTAENISWFNKTVKSLSGTIAGGGNIFHNRFLQSPFMFLSTLSNTARDLGKILYDVNGRPNKYRSLAINGYNARYGVGAFDQATTLGGQEISRMISQDPVLSRSLGELSEVEGKKQYGTFVGLANETGGFRPEGIEASPAARDFYERHPELRSIHEQMYQDPRFRDHHESIREMLERVKEDYHASSWKEINRLYNRLVPEQQALVGPWLNANNMMSSSNYRKLLGKSNKIHAKQFAEIEDSRLGKRLFELNDKLASFNQYKYGYYTQMLDVDKFTALKNSVQADFVKANPGANAQEIRQHVQQWQLDNFMRLNDKASETGAKVYLYRYSDKTNDLEDVTFTTIDQARTMVQNTLIEGRRMTGGAADVVSQDVDRIITQGQDGLYRINMNDPLFEGAFDEFKRAQADQYLKTYMTGATIKSSNYLDRQRKYVIPFEWRVTDVDKWMYKYTQDVGPRNHLMEHGIFDSHDLRTEWLDKIKREVGDKVTDQKLVNQNINRVEDVYNLQMGIIKSAMGEDTVERRIAAMERQIDLEQKISAVRNLFFGAFASTIKFLDILQPLMLGTHISSYRSIAEGYRLLHNNPKAFKQMEDMMQAGGAVSRRLELIHPGMQNSVDINTGNNPFFEWSKKASDFGAKFSVFRATEVGLNKMGINASVDNLGVTRLFVDNFYGVNAASTTINYIGALHELKHLTKRMKDEGLTSELENRFTSLGINKNRIQAFTQQSDTFDDFILRMNTGTAMTREFMDSNASLYDDLMNVMSHVTDAYHGRNLMDRPEAWSSPIGKFLSQFSVYPFNFATQVYKRRVQLPIVKWMEKYNDTIDKDVKPVDIFAAMSTGNTRKLKSWGFTDEAIADLPLDAWGTIGKVLGSFGIGVAAFAGRDAYLDAVNYPMVSMMGGEEEDQWKRTNRNLILNPYAPKGEQVRWSDIDPSEDMGEIMMAMAGWMAKTAILGKAGDLIGPFTQRDGLVSIMGPGMGLANDTFKSISRIANGEFSSLPENTAREVSKPIFQLIPGVGGYGAGRMVHKAIMNQDKATGGKLDFEPMTYDDFRRKLLE
jgi:hypothetical protein